MSIQTIIYIVEAVAYIVLGFVATYFSANATLRGKVVGFIDAAEALYTDAKSGGQKFQYVIGQLYALLPAFLRPFLPQALLAAFVQGIFNQVDAYAKKQLDKAVNKVDGYFGS